MLEPSSANPIPSAVPSATTSIASVYCPQVPGSAELAFLSGLRDWYGGLVHLPVPSLRLRHSQRQLSQRGSCVSGANAGGRCVRSP